MGAGSAGVSRRLDFKGRSAGLVERVVKGPLRWAAQNPLDAATAVVCTLAALAVLRKKREAPAWVEGAVAGSGSGSGSGAAAEGRRPPQGRR